LWRMFGSLDAILPSLTFSSWSTWRGNCADSITSIASYPRAIPGATAVPAWAYINVVAEDRFNATEALALAGGAESSAGGSTSTPASTSSPPASSTSSSTSNSTSPVPTDSGGTTQSNTNTGAIVGGTVGGVVGLGLIICLAIFLMKRQSTKSKHLAPSAEFSRVIPPGSPVPHNFDPAAVGFRSRTNSPLKDGLSSDHSREAPNIQQVGMGHHNGAGTGYGGSPWSPPPASHQNMVYGGHGSNNSYTHVTSGVPEL